MTFKEYDGSDDQVFSPFFKLKGSVFGVVFTKTGNAATVARFVGVLTRAGDGISVINSLGSDSTTDALSAAQGKALKEEIDSHVVKNVFTASHVSSGTMRITGYLDGDTHSSTIPRGELIAFKIPTGTVLTGEGRIQWTTGANAIGIRNDAGLLITPVSGAFSVGDMVAFVYTGTDFRLIANLTRQTGLTNSLTSDSTTTGLTANRGKELKDAIDNLDIPTVENSLNSMSTENALSAFQGRALNARTPTANPGASKYWGTDSSSNLGWFNVPQGGGGGGTTNIQVVPNLNSTSDTAALAASQGKILAGRIKEPIDNLESDNGEVPLSANQGQILDTKITAVRDEYVPKTDIANNLTTEDAGKVLDARQGKELRDLFVDVSPKNYYASTASGVTIAITGYAGGGALPTNLPTGELIVTRIPTGLTLTGEPRFSWGPTQGGSPGVIRDLDGNTLSVASNYFSIGDVIALVHTGSEICLVANFTKIRGVVDSLESDSTTEALTANQGKILNEKIASAPSNDFFATSKGTATNNNISVDSYYDGTDKPDDPPLNSLMCFEVPTGIVNTRSVSITWSTTHSYSLHDFQNDPIGTGHSLFEAEDVIAVIWDGSRFRFVVNLSRTDAVEIDDIANNLTTDTAGKVLDARQGKALKDIIDNLPIPTAEQLGRIPTANPPANKVWKSDSNSDVGWFDDTSGGSEPVEVIDNLNSGRRDAALSANQGMYLNSLIPSTTLLSRIPADNPGNNKVWATNENGAPAWRDNTGGGGGGGNAPSFTVIDSLGSSSRDDALSARQGMILDGKIKEPIDNLESNSTESPLSANQGRLLYGEIQNLPNIYVLKTDVENSLSQRTEGKVLDARQGRALKELIDRGISPRNYFAVTKLGSTTFHIETYKNGDSLPTNPTVDSLITFQVPSGFDVIGTPHVQWGSGSSSSLHYSDETTPVSANHGLFNVGEEIIIRSFISSNEHRFAYVSNITRVAVEDNVTSTSGINALSANQGRLLNAKIPSSDLLGRIPTANPPANKVWKSNANAEVGWFDDSQGGGGGGGSSPSFEVINRAKQY